MIDYSKPLQTRDGREVRIWTTEARCSDDYPVRGEVPDPDRRGVWNAYRWSSSGECFRVTDNNMDLVNVPEKHTLTVECQRYEDGNWGVEFCIDARLYKSLMGNGKVVSTTQLGPFEFTEGEGL